MRRKQQAILMGALMATFGAAPAAHCQTDDVAAQFAGTWRGNSVCVAKSTACHDETVVYRVQKLPARGNVIISADKIVDGKAITMGSLEFHYDQRSKSWLCQYAQGVWRLTVAGAQVNGTLKQPDGTLFRQIALRKDP